MKEAVRVKVKKCELNVPAEWRKFSVDPQITSLEVLYSLLAKAFDIKSDFSIKYKAYDPAGNEIYLSVLSDWDLDAAFLRIHNLSIQTDSEPCLLLQIDIKPFTEVREWEAETTSCATGVSGSSASGMPPSNAREIISPLQQSLGVSQKYVQHMQTKLPGLIMNHMEKTFSIVQKAFNLSEETMASLPPRAPLADSEFHLFLDALGKIQRSDELRKVIFFGGIDPSLRRVVWKHILNVYPGDMNGHQRMDYMRRKSEHYYKLRDTWKTAVKHGHVVGELAYVTSMVKKDVLRTDRLHPFYAGSDDNQNIAALFNILTTYALNHPSVSYCQGMSDIASPLLVTMKDEAQAYICFCAIMARVQGNFMLDGIAMTQKFAHLTEALSFYDPDFWEYLKSQQADDLLFCYRWLLLELKREFPFEDALRMLEVQWSSLKYETCNNKELNLYEKEFVPIAESSAPTTSSSHSGSLPPISPSYLLAKPCENPYTKVCALRRQSSSASLSSLSSSLGNNCIVGKLDNTKRLNQSLDDNIARHATRRQRHASAKAHQSLDETKMLMLMESVENVLNIDAKSNTCDTTAEDTDDDVFASTNTPTCSHSETQHFNFLPTNPFKDDAKQGGAITQTTEQKQATLNGDLCKPVARVFLNSSTASSPTIAEDDSGLKTTTAKITQIPKGIAKLQNKHILSNYNAVSNIIAKQLANATNVSESVKRVGSGGGGHFKDLKDKIAATSRRGMSIDDTNSNEKTQQQKLVKNFNEFLNFTTMNKSRIADRFAATAITTNNTNAEKSSKTPSPTHIALQTNTPQPLVQLTKSAFATSLDDSDESSVPDTTWSGSTAATAIQQANNLSCSNSLQLELASLSSATFTPDRTPTFERISAGAEQPARVAAAYEINDSLTPEDSQEQEYYPMTNAITRELRLEAENLDRQVFGTPLSTHTSSEIEYEKLDKDSLDLLEDLKENEIVACPDVSELLLRRRERDSVAQTRSTIAPLHLVDVAIDGDLANAKDLRTTSTMHATSAPATAIVAHTIDTLKLNPFVNEALLTDVAAPILLGSMSNSSSLPEVLVPISTNMPIASPIELATNAADEIVFSTKSPQQSTTNLNGSYVASSGTQPTIATAVGTLTPPILPPPAEFGGGNPFLMFLCLTLLLQHRNTIMKSGMDYNEIAMHFDKMVRKHDVTRVLNQARRMYIDYLKVQNAYKQQQHQLQQQQHQLQQQQQQQHVQRSSNASITTNS